MYTINLIVSSSTPGMNVCLGAGSSIVLTPAGPSDIGAVAGGSTVAIMLMCLSLD